MACKNCGHKILFKINDAAYKCQRCLKVNHADDLKSEEKPIVFKLRTGKREQDGRIHFAPRSPAHKGR